MSAKPRHPWRRLLAPASWMYRAAVAVRNRRFDRGIGVSTMPIPVVSVGNITMGGVGKTPFVRWVATRLIEHGHHPVIAMRGYGARGDAPSDEEAEYATLLRGVPVLAHPDRTSHLRRFLPEHPEVDVVLLDDGFQHRRIARNLDIALIDASAATMRDTLIPGGTLREPLANLRRADAVVVTRAEEHDAALSERLRHAHGSEPVAWSRHAWSRLDVHASEAAEPAAERVAWLDGRRVAVMFGVGNAPAVTQQVRNAGATIVSVIPVRDHHAYRPKQLARIRRRLGGAEALVVTSKDWVKLRDLIDLTDWPVPIIVPLLELDVWRGADRLTSLLLAAVNASVPSG